MTACPSLSLSKLHKTRMHPGTHAIQPSIHHDGIDYPLSDRCENQNPLQIGWMFLQPETPQSQIKSM